MSTAEQYINSVRFSENTEKKSNFYEKSLILKRVSSQTNS